MRVINVHQRSLAASPERVGALIDTLATADDMLWPVHSWPRMKLDGPLAEGARGGHGPIRYTVEAYLPLRQVRFRFTAPRGLDGWHLLAVQPDGNGGCVLEHRIEMHARGLACLAWPLVYAPLHDALIEDAFCQAEASLGLPVRLTPWPWRVRLLRGLMERRLASRSASRHAASHLTGARHAG